MNLCAARREPRHTQKKQKKNFVSPKNILHTQVCHIFVQVDFYPHPHVMALLRRLREKRVPVWIPPRPSGAYMGKGYRGMRTGEHGGGPAFALALWPLWALSVFGWVQNERLNLLVCWASRGQHLHIKLKLASLLQTPPPVGPMHINTPKTNRGGRPPTPPPVVFPLMSARCLMPLFIPFFGVGGIMFKCCLI